MMTTLRKYALGGYVLPLGIQWSKIGTCPAYVHDAKGRIVRWFRSSNQARAFVKAHNNQRIPRTTGENP